MFVGSKLSYFIFGVIETIAGFLMLYLFIGLPFVAGLIVLVVISSLSFSISTCNLSLGEEVLRKKDYRLQAS